MPPERPGGTTDKERLSPLSTIRIRRLLAYVACGGALAAASITPHANANPGCQSGMTPWGGGGYCDYDYWPDGSYVHCVSTYVLGFGGSSCGRVCPWPDPANMAPPAAADVSPRTPC